MSHILILGGDGYLGWPTAMYFSARGYQVTVADNYFRRNACTELNVGMLYAVPTLVERAKLWYELTGYEIKVVISDLSEPCAMRQLFNGSAVYQWSVNNSFSCIPETVVHFAEQPSAPYSLIDYQHADITLINNLRVTNNLLWAIRDLSPKTHIIKLGTMGEYGTPNIDIEEGWLEVEHKGRKDKFLFPRQASSLYHTTKIMDTDLMWFGVRMWGLKVTDLMQGPVYGIDTEESLIDERFRTIFNYDEIFGTVVNRFIVQAIAGYPLTVYGTGGQTRGYINIKDVLQCIHISEKNPPSQPELKIFNQITETFSVNELAKKTKNIGLERGYQVKIQEIENPRKEEEDHYYNPTYTGLNQLGVKPNLLTDIAMHEMYEVVEKYKNSINNEVIFKGIRW
jgi:UDP-sulfoquinovose synthase